MSKTLVTVLIVVGVIVVAGGLFAAGTFYGRTFGFWNPSAPNYAWNGSYGSGMMGGFGTAGVRGYGMMGGRGYGMMNGFTYSNAAAATLTVDQAKAAAQKYLAALNNSDLQIAEVMIFNNNAYVAVREKSSGIGAFELLVDPASQVAYPEHGPNMMWNLKYSGLNHQNMMNGYGRGMMGGYGGGMMRGYGGGMMGNWNAQPVVPGNASTSMSVTAEQAVQLAQKFLDANVSGTVAATDPMQFYGYYTLDYSRDGKIVGMLSVNGYSAQVFLHTWHGTFVEEAQN